jgi:ADP-ribosyl-[dinitrogen reductase] hydrolase
VTQLTRATAFASPGAERAALYNSRPTMDLTRALEETVAAARAAGALLLADFQRPGGPRGKIDKADADVEAEDLIRTRLVGAFPSWGLLGEETGRVHGEAGAPVWLVDPNDGTRDYLCGRRGSSVSIGLVHEGRPILGVVFAFGYPDDTGRLYAWAEGCGPLTCDGIALETQLVETLSAREVVLVSSGGDRSPSANLRCVAPARYRAVASIAHRLALVAAGDGSAATSLFAPSAWDLAGGHALVRAVGGVLLDDQGAEITYDAEGWCKVRFAFAGSRPLARLLVGRDWKTLLAAPVDDVTPVRLELGLSVADAGLLSRAQGALLGQVAGDSLGSLVEFQTAAQIAARFPVGPSELEDGGIWRTLAGQPTDDSEMALALGRAIVATGHYEPDTVLAAYREWLGSGPFDVGRTTRAALEGQTRAESQANGSLMRISPLAVFAQAQSAAGVADLARRDALLTHPHAVCGDATAAYAVALAHAVRRGDGPHTAYAAAREWARQSAPNVAVVEALESAEHTAPVCDGANQGWVLIALQNAFYELLHAPTVEVGVVRTVRRGGDTDTNAAIAGALLGAVYGRDAVPPQWRQMVLSCRPSVGRAEHPRPWRCWPTDVLELAERLVLAGRPAPR